MDRQSSESRSAPDLSGALSRRKIFKGAVGVAAVGAAAGLLGAWFFRRVVAELVFGISPADPATFLAATLLLITFATSATYFPARRAAKVDPLVALRYE